MIIARSILIALAVLTLPAAACAEDMKMHGDMAMHGAATPSDKAFMGTMKTMMKDMAVKPTGNPDQDFVAMMLPHHQGAVDMAKVELQYGKDPMLRKLASDIIQAQEAEIAMMKAWQSQNQK